MITLTLTLTLTLIYLYSTSQSNYQFIMTATNWAQRQNMTKYAAHFKKSAACSLKPEANDGALRASFS
jgi:hypothetical protein